MEYRSPDQHDACDGQHSTTPLCRKRVLTDGMSSFSPAVRRPGISLLNGDASSDHHIIRHQRIHRDIGLRPPARLVKPGSSKLRDLLRNKYLPQLSGRANKMKVDVKAVADARLIGSSEEGGACSGEGTFGWKSKSREQSSDIRHCNKSSPDVSSRPEHPAEASGIGHQYYHYSAQRQQPDSPTECQRALMNASPEYTGNASKPFYEGKQRLSHRVLPSAATLSWQRVVAGSVTDVTHGSGRASDDNKNFRSTMNTYGSSGRQETDNELLLCCSAKKKDERQLWSKEQDSELRRVMRDLGLDSLFTTKTYYPAGDVDWDAVVVEFNNNLPDRFPRFSKKQVKDRWEQHLRPGLLQHKSLTKPIRQRIVKLLEDAVPRETYINRGKPCVRWMNIASRVWEYGLRCSASTIKNVWNSHLHKMKSGGPGIKGGRPALKGLLETDDEARKNSIDNRTRYQQSTSPSPEIHTDHQLQSELTSSQLAADWQAYWQKSLLDSHAAAIQSLPYSSPLHYTTSRRVSPKSTPFFLSPAEGGCASRELEPTTPSSASEKDAIYSPKHYAAGYQRRRSGSARGQGSGSPGLVDAAARESSLLKGLNSAASISSLYGMHPAYHAAAAVSSTETMYRMYLAAATGYIPPAAAAGHHGYSALDPRGKKRGLPSHGLYPGLYPPAVPGSSSSPSAILSSNKAEMPRSHPRGFLPVDDPYSFSTSSGRHQSPKGMRGTELCHREVGGGGGVPDELLPPYFKRARYT